MQQLSLGIDVGATTVKLVALDPEGRVVTRASRAHHGRPAELLPELLTGPALAAAHVGVTGSGAVLLPPLPPACGVDRVRALCAAAAALCPTAVSIIDIGGASLTLVRLDGRGRFLGLTENSKCAAGTGSFLDEQAARLGLGVDELGQVSDLVDPPSVATRCAVFAKSDLIHLQQAGATRVEMWSGLCRGLAQTALQTLLKGRPLDGPVWLVGGVSQNGEVVRWLRQLVDVELSVTAESATAGAWGAAWLAARQPAATRVDLGAWLPAAQAARATARPVDQGDAVAARPLVLRRTRYPSFAVLESTTDADGNEVRLSAVPPGQRWAGVIGVDVGSTSTKLCFVDERGEVIADIYRRTAGEPLVATQKLLAALAALAAGHGAALEVRGCGTTGSGRKLVGAVLGADRVINEITAHVAGAERLAPDVETIFEIGGQDAKYMRVRDGRIVDANMNFVCAAGTGSFVEEQARKLGVPLEEIGRRVLGLVPPPTSDRCTVFMEQDVHELLRRGHTPDEVLAGVMRSVVQNYLNKVVGRRPISRRRVVFQGATARNPGLVAAFETLLDLELVVSPYCHVMGAWGVALLVQRQLAERRAPTRFVGMAIAEREVTLRRERCLVCQNRCLITFARVAGATEESSWGYLCGREPTATRVRANREFQLMRQRQRWWAAAGATPARAGGPRVVIPRALSAFSHLPWWRRLLGELGAEVHLAEEGGDGCASRGAALCGAEFCFPVKLAHGRAAQALTAPGDWLLVPRVVAEPADGFSANSYFCPYVQAFPAVLAAALARASVDGARLLAPTLDRRKSLAGQASDLAATLGPALGCGEAAVERAICAADATQAEWTRQLCEAGTRALAAASSERPAFLLIGRPYNLYDARANLDLPRKIAELGAPVIPLDALPFEPERLPAECRTLFWAYGQRILSALQVARERPHLFPIYLTNFNCGPDSFLLGYAERLIGDKPMLVLELDEHGADAGYLTRIEAFLDVVARYRPAAPRRAPASHGKAVPLRERRLWIPPMHPVTKELFAAAFRGAGYDARPLPDETRSDLERGNQVTRGGECLPMRATVGVFLRQVEQDPTRPHALFMPTNKGPCRFGQYAPLDRAVFARLGLDVEVLSPSADNTYAGMSDALRRGLWRALVGGDVLFKLACRVRPYERRRGDADLRLRVWTDRAIAALERGEDLRPVLRRAGIEFARLPTCGPRRPLVGVVGEIYVRNNGFANEQLVRVIEAAGGEAWMTPISEWLLFTAWDDARRFRALPKTFSEGFDQARRLVKSRWLSADEHAMVLAAGDLLADRQEPPVSATVQAAQPYLPFNIGGESILTIGRTVLFARQGAALVVNASPFGCMAGNVSAAVFARLEQELGLPVVNQFYDGAGDENARLVTCLANLTGAPPPTRRRRSLVELTGLAAD